MKQENHAVADRELMRRIVNGEASAYTILYRRLAPTLIAIAYSILRDQTEAEDTVQETLVHVWKKASTYDSTRSTLFTWAVMVSRSKAIDRLRARARRSRKLEEAGAEAAITIDQFAPDAHESVERRDKRRWIETALSRLPEAQREAIQLAFYRGLTQAEIAETLRAPLGTVKARIRRGLCALRLVLDENSHASEQKWSLAACAGSRRMISIRAKGALLSRCGH